MCGIVAIICKNPTGLFAYDRDAFEDMLVANSIRGLDSTGVFGVSLRNEVHIVKQGIDPVNFFRAPSYKEWGNKIPQFRVVVGHNRKATHGDISSTNAHPFKEGHIVLVHNGMLWAHKDIKSDVEVDSHALCHGFADKGARETLKEVNGAFALIWYDIKEKKLFLWRNDDRPLALVETSQNIYIASELGMLKWLLNREKRSVTILREGEIVTNTLYSITLDPFKLTTEPLAKKPYMSPIVLPETRTSDDDLAGWLKDEVSEIKEPPLPPVSGLQASSKEIRVQYPFDSKVIFSVGDIKTHTDSPRRFEVRGKIFLPGKPLLSGYIYTDSQVTLTTLKSWKDSRKLVGEVGRILGLRDGSTIIHLKNGTIELPEMIKTWNKTILPKLEWNLICSLHKCHKCNKGIKENQPDFTSVNERKLGEYRVICADCITKALPNDKKVKLLTGPIKQSVEHPNLTDHAQSIADSLKGNTHGS